MANVLTPRQKRFIVANLGAGAGVMETAKLFHAEYGVQLSYQQILRYDPTKATGASLSKPLQKLFFKSRERAAASLHECELSHAAIRQRRLDDLYTQATIGIAQGEGSKKKLETDHKLALAILTESRKNSEAFVWDGEAGEDEGDE